MKPQTHRSIYPPGHQATGPLGHRATDPQCHRSTGPPSHRFTQPPDHWVTKPQTIHPLDHQSHWVTRAIKSPGLPYLHPTTWLSRVTQAPGLLGHLSTPQTRVRAKATDPPIHPDPRLRVTGHRPQTQNPRATDPRATMITDLGSWSPPIGHPQSSKKPGGHLAP
jgi:hypothetical protein